MVSAHGAAFFHTQRGGSITYHGPGQLVGYPIVHLSCLNYDLHQYLRVLEEACIRALADWGVQATRDSDYTGVWVNQEKIVSIGVRVSRKVAMHGFALNITPELGAFNLITPCGINGRGITSLAALGVKTPALPDAANTVARHLADMLGHKDRRTVSIDTLLGR
jgi:lipoic acid synthetase